MGMRKTAVETISIVEQSHLNHEIETKYLSVFCNRFHFYQQIDYSSEETQELSSPETFMTKLKRRWIEKTVMTRNNSVFSVKVGEVPPTMAPAVVGAGLVNTEHLSQGEYSARCGLELSFTPQTSLEELSEISKTCRLPYSGVSKVGGQVIMMHTINCS
ncbi:hypothetical protein AC249_AIPGENE22004 [Exaiptasia diaphana]|nr:hypothetical protein AC249_AIPGENE22004 [Exaiptasia diaphana]